MRFITSIEHGWLDIGEDRDLSQAEADRLAAMEPLLPPSAFQWGRNRVKFTQFCGVVQCGDLQIEVLPKLFPNQTPVEQRHTLLNMLQVAGEIEPLSLGQAALAHTDSSLLDIFIRHFAQLLESQLRQGMLQDYVDREENLGQIRGRINLVRQCRENSLSLQRTACRFNELSPDTPFNRLIHSALLAILPLARSQLLKQYLSSLLGRFADIPPLGPRDKPPASTDLNRMQRRYTAVMDMANMFLCGQFQDLRSGGQKLFSLLFDMNRLFERYVARILRRPAALNGFQLLEQRPRLHLGRDPTGKEHLLMKPDITLIRAEPPSGQKISAIIDTKWKQLADDSYLARLAPADLYQVTGYACRYGASVVSLAYPLQPALTGPAPRVMTIDSQWGPITLLIVGIPLVGQVVTQQVKTLFESL